MSAPIRRYAFAATIVLLFASSVAAGDSGPGQGPLVLLRNGHVLYGELANLGDRCVVTLSQGGEVRIASKEVVIACETLEEAYQHLAQQRTDRRGAGPRIALAKWCLRQGLLEHAAQELALAQQLDPRHAELPGLGRQLEHAQRLAAQPPAPAAAPAPAKNTAAVRPASNVRPLVSPEQLEATMEALPKDSVQLFTNTIQPILLHRCGGGRCHDANSNTGLALLRPTAGAQIWRRLTLRNLHSAVQHVDRKQPQQSNLLTYSLQPHGGSGDAVLAEDSAAYQQLFVWVHRAAGTPPNQKPIRLASAEMEVETQEATPPLAPQLTEPRPLPSDGMKTAAALPPAANDAGDAAATASETAEGNLSEDADAPFQPRDPFDPEIFNRRFR